MIEQAPWSFLVIAFVSARLSVTGTVILFFVFLPACTGMTLSPTFANVVTEEPLHGMMQMMHPAVGFAMIVVLWNSAEL